MFGVVEMTHNQIIENFKKKLPNACFYQYWAKSRYGKNAFDVTYIYNNICHCIEFKRNYDKLKPHQRIGLELAAANAKCVKSWVIRGAMIRKGALLRGYVQLEDLEGNVLIGGKITEIVNYLNEV